MLKDYVEKYSSIFKGTATAMPEITGYIYIENSDIIDEGYIRNTLQSNNYYPNLNFFFKNVKPGYSGTFVQIDEDGKKNIIGIQKIAADDLNLALLYDSLIPILLILQNQSRITISLVGQLMPQVKI